MKCNNISLLFDGAFKHAFRRCKCFDFMIDSENVRDAIINFCFFWFQAAG